MGTEIINELGLDEPIVKEAHDTCPVEQEGATRTQGFWKTHCAYTQHVFDVHLGGYINLGWVVIDEPNELFAIFYAKKPHNSTGTRRSKLCQAHVTVSSQVVAILNSGLSNGLCRQMKRGLLEY